MDAVIRRKIKIDRKDPKYCAINCPGKYSTPYDIVCGIFDFIPLEYGKIGYTRCLACRKNQVKP